MIRAHLDLLQPSRALCSQWHRFAWSQLTYILSRLFIRESSTVDISLTTSLSNTCRIAFHGALLQPITEKDYEQTVLPRIRIFKLKCKEGAVDRVSVIVCVCMLHINCLSPRLIQRCDSLMLMQMCVCMCVVCVYVCVCMHACMCVCVRAYICMLCMVLCVCIYGAWSVWFHCLLVHLYKLLWPIISLSSIAARWENSHW